MKVIRQTKLHSPILRPGVLRSELEKLVAEAAFDVERTVKEAMQAPKHGRTYRRGRITKAFSSKLPAGLRTFTTEAGKRRAIVGYKLHRASAPGEAPAVDTSSVINSILTKPDGLRATITANEVAAILEEKMNRPAFGPAVEKVRPGFIVKVGDAIGRLC
jgi:hypothetical protein